MGVSCLYVRMCVFMCAKTTTDILVPRGWIALFDHLKDRCIMYVCMHACVYVTYVNMDRSIYLNIHTCTDSNKPHTYICTLVNLCTCKRIHQHTYTYVHTCIHTYEGPLTMRASTYPHLRPHTYIHAYIHTYT